MCYFEKWFEKKFEDYINKHLGKSTINDPDP